MKPRRSTIFAYIYAHSPSRNVGFVYDLASTPLGSLLRGHRLPLNIADHATQSVGAGIANLTNDIAARGLSQFLELSDKNDLAWVIHMDAEAHEVLLRTEDAKVAFASSTQSPDDPEDRIAGLRIVIREERVPVKAEDVSLRFAVMKASQTSQTV